MMARLAISISIVVFGHLSSNASSFKLLGTRPQVSLCRHAKPCSSVLRQDNIHVIRAKSHRMRATSSTQLQLSAVSSIQQQLSSVLVSAADAATSAEAQAMTSDLFRYFMQTLISVTVNGAVIALFVAFTIFMAKRSDDQSSLKKRRFGRPGKRGGKRGKKDSNFYYISPEDGAFNSAEELYDDLYGLDYTDESRTSLLQKIFQRSDNRNANPRAKINLGIPAEQYIKVKRLNDIYTSYQFSMDAAIKSRAYASSRVRRSNFQRALERALQASPSSSDALKWISPNDQVELLRAEQEFLKEAAELVGAVQEIQSLLTQKAIEKAMDEMDVQIGQVDTKEYKTSLTSSSDQQTLNVTDAIIVSSTSDANATGSSVTEGAKETKSDIAKNFFKSIFKLGGSGDQISRDIEELYEELAQLTLELAQLETEFITAVMDVLGPSRANGLRVALLGNAHSPNGESPGALVRSLQERPLSLILRDIGLLRGDGGAPENGSFSQSTPRRVFVTNFPGDVTASQVQELREETTAIIQAANPMDEAVVILQSGGGTVTGYGLAAAQLRRFKAAGMKLTICVEQVAASGGYMMCCVADRIVASPFAVLGSIGVISELPNVYERLKKEGIEFQTVTAGKYKRTLTPTKKVTKEDLDKSKADIEDVLALFKNFVKENRPRVDIEEVATGETWFGEDALKKNLCDEIKTKDEVLLEYVQEGCDVFEVTYEPSIAQGRGLLPLPLGEKARNRPDDDADLRSLIRQPIRWLVRTLVKEVKQEFDDLFASSSVATRRNAADMYKVTDAADTANRVMATTARSLECDNDISDIEKLF